MVDAQSASLPDLVVERGFFPFRRQAAMRSQAAGMARQLGFLERRRVLEVSLGAG